MNYGISGIPILSIVIVVSLFSVLLGYLLFAFKKEKEEIDGQIKRKSERLTHLQVEKKKLGDMSLLVESINASGGNTQKLDNRLVEIEEEAERLQADIKCLKEEWTGKGKMQNRLEQFTKWGFRGVFCVFFLVTVWRLFILFV
ncbi:hypothetical protein P6P90_06740 [Ectobacillus antri]|jgi:peptidoglycan hydrolase CwlO-like protein|uniref:Uncharacterized protein n=1 Tax=Ectobacillus antri TaxID=2486280 RepID=A0ABT6H374_9BACI|nr:hypothetical protein [Ectobacillus antri]MDG4658090.1 hypothetical protein [Ectobacillus antri]MDG5753669.1 hypothetical protein [Ectobacillus antri]